MGTCWGWDLTLGHLPPQMSNSPSLTPPPPGGSTATPFRLIWLCRYSCVSLSFPIGETAMVYVPPEIAVT